MLYAPLAFGASLTGAAAIACLLTFRNLLRARRCVAWPTVEATIVESKVVKGNKGSRPWIAYTYRVAGITYTSARVVVGGLWETSGDGPARLVGRFHTGAVASVAIDPRDPAYSVLLPGVKVHQVLSAVFSVVALAGTLPVLWGFMHLALMK